MKDSLNEQADSQFVESVLADVNAEIEYIENKYHTSLIGDRSSFSQARRDWVHMSKGQVLFMASLWTQGIRRRYP